MSKERKGNSNSVTANIGMSTVWHPEQIANDDFYTTDPAAVREFLDTVHECYVPHGQIVWEPACGTGNISEVLKEYGYVPYSTDLKDRGYGISSVDFLQVGMVAGCKTIITNPPYSLATEFIEHAMEILPDYGYYIALMDLNYLAGQRRHDAIYSNKYLKAIWIYTHRILCWKNDVQDGHRSPVNYAWYIFQRGTPPGGFVLPPTIHWIT